MSTNATRAQELAEQAYETAHAGDKATAAIGATLAVAHAVLALVEAVKDATRREHGPHHKGSTWCRCGSAFDSSEALADHISGVAS